MELRNLGFTGLKVSLTGLGCNNFGRRCDEAQTRAVVNAALDSGINFFDTADVYGPAGLSETYLGAALQGAVRQDVIIATKFGNPMGEGAHVRGASRRYIMSAVEASLKRLGTDYIDLYQQHVPDTTTPIDETLRALDDLVSQGKVRYLGNSNFTAWQIADADWTARTNNATRFASAQNLYNLLDRRIEREVVPACDRYGIGLLPYFPLASGMLTGKYKRGTPPPAGTRLAAWGARGQAAMSDDNFDVVEALEELAAGHSTTVLAIAMGWLASRPVVSSVIAGATSAEQVHANAEACQVLSHDLMAAIDELVRR